VASQSQPHRCWQICTWSGKSSLSTGIRVTSSPPGSPRNFPAANNPRRLITTSSDLIAASNLFDGNLRKTRKTLLIFAICWTFSLPDSHHYRDGS